MAPPPRPRRRPGRRAAVVAAVVALALVAAACGVEAGAKAPVGAKPDDSGVLGSDVGQTTSTTETPTTVPPPTDLQVTGADDTDVNRAALNAVADLQAWWADEYPQVYGSPYRPLSGGLFAIDRSTPPRSVPCSTGSIDQLLDNAFYCPPSDAVVWDQQEFMPALADRYGLFTVAVVIAHEWGHLIQDRARYQAPSVIYELQADCFAGAWVAHVVDDGDARFTVGTDDLDQALAGVLSLRDAPGGSADDPYAHGSGFDRVGAFQDGYEAGAGRCADYRNGDPAPYQFPFLSESDFQNQGDLPLDGPDTSPGILQLVFPSLDAYWTDTYPTLSGGDAWDPLGDPVAFQASDPPTCDGKEVTQYLLFVCIPDRYVGYEASTTIPDAYRTGGDFAVATLLATQYGLDVVDQLGSATTEVQATLQADCLAGSWAAALLPPDTPEAYQLVLSPGDLDEGVAVLLSSRSARDRQRQGPGFDRVRAFRQGVVGGATACPAITGS